MTLLPENSRFGERGYAAVEAHAQGTVLFRTDAGHLNGLSTGHMFRCLQIAGRLAERGHRIVFLSKDYPLARQILTASGNDIHYFDTTSSEVAIMEALSWETLITDYPEAHLFFHQYPKRDAWLWIDETYEIPSDPLDPRVDVIVRPSVVSPSRFYNVTARTKVYWGGDFFFPHVLLERVGEKRRNAPRDSVCVFMGGSDPFGYSAPVSRILCQAGMKVKLIVGAGNQRKGELAAIDDGQIQVHIAPEDPYAIMASCRSAVVSGGLVSYEAWYLGIPAVIFPTTPIEQRNRNAFYTMIPQAHSKGEVKEWLRFCFLVKDVEGESRFLKGEKA